MKMFKSIRTVMKSNLPKKKKEEVVYKLVKIIMEKRVNYVDHGSLKCCFVWASTKEGRLYWGKIEESLQKKVFDKEVNTCNN